MTLDELRPGTASPSLAAEEPVGEVVEATTTDFQAQASTLDGGPPFGSFVEVAIADDALALGVVARVQTAGIDPSARPIMRGHDHVRDALIYAENPDLPHVLRTVFRAILVGYREGGTWRQFLPSHPPRLHYSVRQASPAMVRAFTDLGLTYLGTLLATAENGSAEELIAANVRQTGAVRGEPDAFALRAGRELTLLLRADYTRFTAIMRRIVPERP